VIFQPPEGETWLVDIAGLNTSPASGADIYYGDYDGTTFRKHTGHISGGSYGDECPHFELTRIWTYSLHGRISASNPGSSSCYLYYGYSGFKLSQPLWSPKRLIDPNPMPWKKPTSLTLPSAIAPLQKYAFDILGIDPNKPNDYGLAVILEEDTPLAIDPATNFPIERVTVFVKADVLADLIAKFKAKTADPVITGYAKYLDKWKLEGIDFGV
jgi:hypothetical protein